MIFNSDYMEETALHSIFRIKAGAEVWYTRMCSSNFFKAWSQYKGKFHYYKPLLAFKQVEQK